MKLYNTLTRQIDEVQPLEAGKIKMYTCGLTVYSQPQIGNWVAYIYSDVLTRVLLASGFTVNRIQNITDVGHLVSDEDTGEDKMEKGARSESKTAWQVADKYIDCTYWSQSTYTHAAYYRGSCKKVVHAHNPCNSHCNRN